MAIEESAVAVLLAWEQFHHKHQRRRDQEESFIKEQVAQTMQEINQVGGIPNFYGHQRFGTTRPITHLVGKAILKGDFQEAAMIFLAKPSPDEHPSSRQARTELQETRDFKLALEHFPKQLRYERSMLNYLAEKPDDFTGAFRTLPAKLQALFVQAYQSYLFNRFLSERVKAVCLWVRLRLAISWWAWNVQGCLW